jgi:Icc-related predicted phosphoesterase
MKISLVSDLHLENGYQELPGGEVLILAGDICEARDFKKEFHSTRLTDRQPGSMKWFDFFYHECAKYDRVFYVMGNHEHYHGRFDRTYHDLKSILPDNVRLLEDEHEVYNGVLFIGSTLWTDCNKNNPLTIHVVKYSMNDYRIIKNHYLNKDIYYKLTPEYTISVHKKSREYIQTTLEQNQHLPAVVITHHGPSSLSIDEKYKNDHEMNGAYTSDLSDLILDHTNIKFWVHGHMHDPVDYLIGDTHVVSNPRGYVGYEDTSRFDPNFTVNVES